MHSKKIVWCSSYYLSHLMLVSSYVCCISHFVLSYVSHIWYWSHLSYVCPIWHSVLSDIGLIWCVPHLTSCIVLCLSHLTYVSYYVDVSYTWLIWQKYHITSVCLTCIFVPQIVQELTVLHIVFAGNNSTSMISDQSQVVQGK